MMNSVLQNCIDIIGAERELELDKSFDSVEELIEEFGEDEFADKVFNETPRLVPFEIIADLLSIAIWSTNDNGAGIVRTMKRWLNELNDERKLLIALNLDAIPFESEDSARQFYERVPERFWRVRLDAHRIVDHFVKQRQN